MERRVALDGLPQLREARRDVRLGLVLEVELDVVEFAHRWRDRKRAGDYERAAASRTGRSSSRSALWPAWICFARSVSALNSAPSRIARLVSHSHSRKTTTPPSVP